LSDLSLFKGKFILYLIFKGKGSEKIGIKPLEDGVLIGYF
jgi:hypothetical protein